MQFVGNDRADCRVNDRVDRNLNAEHKKADQIKDAVNDQVDASDRKTRSFFDQDQSDNVCSSARGCGPKCDSCTKAGDHTADQAVCDDIAFDHSFDRNDRKEQGDHSDIDQRADNEFFIQFDTGQDHDRDIRQEI